MQLKEGRAQISVATRYATKKRSSANNVKSPSKLDGDFTLREEIFLMNIGHFYYLDDSYFTDFPDPYLERNKETEYGVLHGRPCFFSIVDIATQIIWLIPFSSKVAKFKRIWQEKINKTGKCDTIVFGNVLGYEKAFLIQNMCPAIPKYISSEYIDKNTNSPVRVGGMLEKELIQKSSLVLALARQGKRVIFPNVFWIEEELKKQMGI